LACIGAFDVHLTWIAVTWMNLAESMLDLDQLAESML
jgi:hypothetical protein